MVSFTLAEVLIVLGIIGLIADMTIPTIIAKTQVSINVAALKKSYSTLESAYRLAVSENGTPDNWDLNTLNSGQGAENMLNILAKYLRVSKNCGTTSGCLNNISHKFLNNDSFTLDNDDRRAKLILADGTILVSNVTSPTCALNSGDSKPLKNSCGWLYVDTNGQKEPNIIGKDLFLFVITKYGIIPSGIETDSSYPFGTSCKTSSDGWGCTAWVIYNENMDYLHCNDLSWTGKKRCN